MEQEKSKILKNIRQIPKSVIAMAIIADAWIIGSAANPDIKSPKDIDVLIPTYNWFKIGHLIPKDAILNKFGGWKYIEDGEIIDVFLGDLPHIMKHHKFTHAWHYETNTLITKL